MAPPLLQVPEAADAEATDVQPPPADDEAVLCEGKHVQMFRLSKTGISIYYIGEPYETAIPWYIWPTKSEYIHTRFLEANFE